MHDTEMIFKDLSNAYTRLMEERKSPYRVRINFKDFVYHSQQLSGAINEEFKQRTGGKTWDGNKFTGWDDISNLFRQLRVEDFHSKPILIEVSIRFYHSVNELFKDQVSGLNSGTFLVTEAIICDLDPFSDDIPDKIKLYMADENTGEMTDEVIKEDRKEYRFAVISRTDKTKKYLDKIKNSDLFELSKHYYKTLQDYYEFYEMCAQGREPNPEEGITVEKVLEEFETWDAVESEATKYKNINPIKADQIYQSGIDKFPDNHKLICNYAIFLFEVIIDYEKADEMYSKALKIEPESAKNIGNYALFIHRAIEDYDKAEEMYKKALEIEPRNAMNLCNYATFLCDIRNDYDKAEQIYKEALEIEPENLANVSNYAIFLHSIRRDYKRAEQMYKKALEIEPKSAINYNDYANFLSQVHNDYDKSEKMYRKALEIDPKNAGILVNYAIFLNKVRKDYKRAEKMYKKALKIEPENTKCLVSYAILLSTRCEIT